MKLLPALLALAALAAQAGPEAQRAQRNYTQYCSGCHVADGSGSPAKGIPAMHDGVLGRFLDVPGGRGYIVQVPGVMNSGLKDEDVAQLMNWLVPRMDPARDAPGYTAAEIAALRRTRPLDVAATRKALIEQLATQQHHGDRQP